jgi:hypothetical protein
MPRTGQSTDNCFMNWTTDCLPGISGEHFVSASVLRVVGNKHVEVNGPPWLRGGSKALPIKGLVANILCKRHNSAMSPLDTVAGKFFEAVRWIYDDLGNQKTLSRKRHWFLFSGQELELWFVKTAFGLYYSGNVGKDGKKLSDTQGINPTMLKALHGGQIVPPCGLHVLKDRKGHSAYRNTLSFQSLSSDQNERMIGLRLSFMGLEATILVDPQVSTYGEDFFTPLQYRPTYLMFRNRRRQHTIVLTWPLEWPQNAVLFDAIGQRATTQRSG